MNQEKKKLIGAILLLAVLTALFGGFLLLSNSTSKTRQRMEARVSEIKAIDEALRSELELYLSVTGGVVNRGMSETLMSAAACRNLADSGLRAPTLFLNGAVVRVTEKGIETPRGFPADVKLDAAQMQGEGGLLYTYAGDETRDMRPLYVVNYSRIGGALYYLEWESYEALDAGAKALFDFEKSFAATEKAFGTDLLLILPASAEGGEHQLFYRSKDLPDCQSAEALGMTDQMLAGAFSASEELTADALIDACETVDINGQSYELLLRQLGGEVMPGAVVAYLTPFRGAKQLVREQTGIGVAVFAIIGTVFLVWLFSVIQLVRRHALSDKQREEYSVGRCTRRVFAILGVGAAVMLVSTALFLSLFRLFDLHRQVDTALTALQQRLTENAEQGRIAANANKEIYGEYVSLAAKALTEYPGVFDAEDFQTICDLIGAEHLMLFDENGDEVLSNSDFVCLSLGTDASSASYEFRQLLTGVPLITREAVTDEQTRLKNVVIGARVGSPEEGERYGALLLDVPEKTIYSGSAETVENILRTLVSKGMLAFSVDPVSGLIRDASDGTLSGLDASSLGLPERALKSGFQDFFTLGGASYYGKNVSIDGVLYFFAVRTERIYSGIPAASLLAALVAFALWSLLALYLLRVYRKTYDRFASVGAPLHEPVNEIRLSDGTRRLSTDPSRRWGPGASDSEARKPLRNAALTAQILFVLCTLLLSVNLYAAQSGEGSSLIGFILQGQWTKGFNLFAVTSVFLLLGETLVAVTVAKLLLQLVSRALGTRGETVCRLLLNLVGYVGGIFFVYYALYDLGFTPGTLLASLGLLSFAVSLGAKDLVTDIVAGLSIVFEGTYQVGDIIELSGYRGEVLEIGVRSTKLEGRGGNIKVIANRDVKNVVNMTRKHSWYALEVTVPADQTLEKTEALLRERLPRIGASIPEIISGPYYKGVTGLGKGNSTLSIIAECNEADYHTVQRALNRAIQELFTEHEIRTM